MRLALAVSNYLRRLNYSISSPRCQVVSGAGSGVVLTWLRRHVALLQLEPSGRIKWAFNFPAFFFPLLGGSHCFSQLPSSIWCHWRTPWLAGDEQPDVICQASGGTGGDGSWVEAEFAQSPRQHHLFVPPTSSFSPLSPALSLSAYCCHSLILCLIAHSLCCFDPSGQIRVVDACTQADTVHLGPPAPRPWCHSAVNHCLACKFSAAFALTDGRRTKTPQITASRQAGFQPDHAGWPNSNPKSNRTGWVHKAGLFFLKKKQKKQQKKNKQRKILGEN